MVVCSCVQVAVNTLKVVAAVRASRKVPTDVCVIAIEPVAARAEPAPTGTVTVRPLTVDVTVESRVALEDGPVGLPPQAAAPASASSPAAMPQHAQNSRRVGEEGSLILLTCHLIRAEKRALGGSSKIRDMDAWNPLAIHSVYRHS